MNPQQVAAAELKDLTAIFDEVSIASVVRNLCCKYSGGRCSVPLGPETKMKHGSLHSPNSHAHVLSKHIDPPVPDSLTVTQ